MSLQDRNPYRQLPDDADIIATLHDVKSIMFLLAFKLGKEAQLTDEGIADLNRFAKMLRNIETRKDMTWQILDEAKAEEFVDLLVKERLARVEDVGDLPPFLFSTRLMELKHHWQKQRTTAPRPLPWDPSFSTTYIKPLTSGDEAVASLAELGMTATERAGCDEAFADHLRRRRRVMSYLEQHPADPTGWEPAPGVTMAEAMKDSNSTTDPERVAKSELWVPVYRSAADIDHLELLTPPAWKDPEDPALSPEEKTRVQESNERAHKARLESKSDPSRNAQSTVGFQGFARHS